MTSLATEDITQPIKTDVLLIGAGPIGLEMAVALKDAGIDYVHVDARQIGHTISWFPRQARFFSSPERIAICGVPLLTVDQSKATREEYLTYLLAVAQQFDLRVQAYERVTELRRVEDRFEVVTERAGLVRRYRARHVISAIGDMHRPRPLELPGTGPVPGSDLPHVSSYFDEPHPYVGQRLLIVGGRNSAVEAAVRCYRAGAKVAISYRREQLDDSIKYWLKPEIEWLIQTGAVEFHRSSVPVAIDRQAVTLARVDTSVEPMAVDRANTWQIPVDFVLLLIGYQMDTSLLAGAGVELLPPNGRPEIDPLTQQTNIPGLYVIGTAAAGTQLRYRLFIENCHSHVVRVLRHLTGRDPRHINPLAYSRLHEQPLAAES